MDCVESSSFVAYGVLGTLPHMLKRWITLSSGFG